MADAQMFPIIVLAGGESDYATRDQVEALVAWAWLRGVFVVRLGEHPAGFAEIAMARPRDSAPRGRSFSVETWHAHPSSSGAATRDRVMLRAAKTDRRGAASITTRGHVSVGQANACVYWPGGVRTCVVEAAHIKIPSIKIGDL